MIVPGILVCSSFLISVRMFIVLKALLVDCCALYSCLQLLRGGIWACMRYPCLCLVGFWNGDKVSLLPYVSYHVVVEAILNILVRNPSPRGSMCFRCLILVCQDPVTCYMSNIISLYFLKWFCSSWVLRF